MHAPTQPFTKVSYAAKAAKAVKVENKKPIAKQTKARPPTIDTMKRILSEPTGPSKYLAATTSVTLLFANSSQQLKSRNHV
ncbi:hypothetical protein DFQ30_005814 [Apophysomyces sp. BC1015]|nr:hypothetical protein DFQ30_005814 [Apophysomyces sp. BC1015]